MENQNLAIVLALVSLVTGIALLVNWSSNRQVPGLLKIALGFMATCVGILLASMQEFISSLCIYCQRPHHGRSHLCALGAGEFLESRDYEATPVLPRLVSGHHGRLLLFYLYR